MKNTIKLFLTIALFCTTTLAEGNMGSGGFTEGNMGSGGKTCTSNCIIENQPIEKESDDSTIKLIKDYLISIFI